MNNIKELILSEQSYMVMAGAGAGKTTRLVNHIVENFISFKKKHGRWPRIIGTTFTKKAATEIQDRVSVLHRTFNNPEIIDYAYSSSLNIGTVHSLCLKLLRSKSHLIGYPQDFKVVNAETLGFAKKKILHTILDSDFQDLLKDFEFQKLMTILNFMDKSNEINYVPITETHQIAILKEFIQELYIRFNTLFNQITVSDLGNIKNSQLAFDYLRGFQSSLFQAKESCDLKPVNDFFLTNDFRKPTYKIKDELKQLLWSKIWDLRNEIKKEIETNFEKMYDIQIFKKLSKSSSRIFYLFQKYKDELAKFKKSSGCFELSDIEPLTLDLLMNHKNDCQDFIKQWDYYYIDEYQDTNLTQKKIFDILIENVGFFKVGDPQQSIYLFRGAKASIYEQEFSLAKDNDRINLNYLDVNYRSKKPLLLAVNELFKNIDSNNFRPMKPQDESIELIESDLESKLVKIHTNLTDVQEKDMVIAFIKNKLDSGVKANDICILARTKSLLYKFENELSKHNIPSVLLVAGNFENRFEIRQCIRFLSFLEEPNDDHNLYTLLKSKVFSISDDLLMNLFENYKVKKSWSLWQMINSSPYDELALAKELNQYLKIYQNHGRVEAFKTYLNNSNLLNLAKNKNDLNRRHSNLYKLLTEVISESVDNLKLSESLKGIIASKYKSQASEAVFSSSDLGVKLMTIHGSKGLEFEHVLVVGCHVKGNLTYTEAIEVNQEGTFVAPLSDVQKNIKLYGPILKDTRRIRIASERQETLRQIYVAATRAKSSLTFFGQSNVGDNSIYKNMKIDSNNDFNWIDVFEAANSKKEKADFHFRDWDFKSYKNEVYDYNQILISQTKAVLMKPNEIDRKEPKSLKNISITSLVHQIFDKNSNFSFQVIKEFTLFKYESRFLDHTFQKSLAGELFHKYFELFAKRLKSEELQERFKNTYLGDLSGLQEVIDSLLIINDPNFREIFKSARAEWGFNSLLFGDFLVSGQVDLWGFDEKGDLHIVDYKTGPSKFKKKAALQVHLYKEVLQKIYPEKNIKTHVLYITEGQLVTFISDLKLNPSVK